jgi:hypothetical protein
MGLTIYAKAVSLLALVIAQIVQISRLVIRMVKITSGWRFSMDLCWDCLSRPQEEKVKAANAAIANYKKLRRAADIEISNYRAGCGNYTAMEMAMQDFSDSTIALVDAMEDVLAFLSKHYTPVST